MTSFGSVFKAMFKDKSKVLVATTIASVPAIFLIVILTWFPNLFGELNLAVQGALATIVALVLFGSSFGILFVQETFWEKNQYQLIPISQVKLVWANFLSSVLLVVINYLAQLAILISAGFALRGFKLFDIVDEITKDFSLNGGISLPEIIVILTLVFFTFTFLSFAILTLINLSFTAFQKRFIKFPEWIKYVGIFLLFGSIGNLFDHIDGFFSNGPNVLLGSLILWVVATLVITMFSSWIFAKYVETKK